MMNAQRTRVAGIAYTVGSVMWLVGGAVAVAVWGGGDPPPGTAGFYIVEGILVLIQALLLAGFFGVRWSGGVGYGVWGTIAFGIGVLGHLLFLAGEVHSLLIGTLSDELVALGALVSALGLLLTGIAVLAAKRWQGWTRWTPLAAGVYPWLIMFPFLIIAGGANGAAIVGWGAARLLLGVAIYAQAPGRAAAAAARVRLPQGDVQ